MEIKTFDEFIDVANQLRNCKSPTEHEALLQTLTPVARKHGYWKAQDAFRLELAELKTWFEYAFENEGISALLDCEFYIDHTLDMPELMRYGLKFNIKIGNDSYAIKHGLGKDFKKVTDLKTTFVFEPLFMPSSLSNNPEALKTWEEIEEKYPFVRASYFKALKKRYTREKEEKSNLLRKMLNSNNQTIDELSDPKRIELKIETLRKQNEEIEKQLDELRDSFNKI